MGDEFVPEGGFFQTGAPPPGLDLGPIPTTAAETGGLRLAADSLAQAILDGTVAHFTAAGVDLPARRYPAPGAPRQVAWDCEQVTVTAAGVAWGPAASVGTEQSFQVGSAAGSRAVRHLIMEVAIVRKLPRAANIDEDDSMSTATVPDVEAMAEAGRAHLVDLGLLSQAVVAMFGPQPGASILSAGTHAQPGVVESQGPEGGFVGTTCTITVTLGDTA